MFPFKKIFRRGYRALRLSGDNTYSAFDKELAATAPDQRNWKGIGIALLVICAVCSLIVTAVVLLTPDEVGRVTKPRIKLREVLKGDFVPKRFNGTWISNHELLYRDLNGSLVIYDVKNEKIKTLIPYTEFNQLNAIDYSVSPDRQYVALSTNVKKFFRYSQVAIYKIYHVETRKVFPVKTLTKNPYVMLFKWGPVNNSLIFVNIYNIYYAKSAADAERKTITKLTQTGSDGPRPIFHGVPDWLYEEEILTSNEAVWFSPNGRFLCYATFDDRMVKSIRYQYYGEKANLNFTYPKTISVKYPKPGTINPRVFLSVIDLTTFDTRSAAVKPPTSIENSDHYFTSASWINENALSVIWMKRSQDYAVITKCDRNSGWKCFLTQNVTASDAKDGKSWVELYEDPIYSANGDRYFLRLPVTDGDAGDFQNIAMIKTKDKHKSYITHGRFVVTQILAYSNELNNVYYLSTLEGEPGQRQLFSVEAKTNPHPQQPKCMTCVLGDECLYNNAIFSPDTKYYVLECLGPRVPYIALYETKDNTKIMDLDSNNDLQELVKNRAMPQKIRYQIPLQKGFKAEVRLLLPPEFRKTDVIRYPLLVFVYGGPGSQLVSHKFEVSWGSYLASYKGIIVASIDGRGSGFQGDRMVNQLYKKLGQAEVADQISVTRDLTDSVKFIDPDHVAIWGWSYGGFVTAMALADESQNVFQCGIAVAPVTSWEYYDSVYTERYMRTPRENDEGYKQADILRKVGNLRNKKFFLVHGSADDNVHFQQSMLLAKQLNRAGVSYRMQVYPDENHFLGTVKTHLYRSMEDFLDYCFPEENLETYALKQMNK